MDLAEATKNLLRAENTVVVEHTSNPVRMSQLMADIAMWANTIESHLAQLEKDYENSSAQLYKRFMLDERLSASAAEKRVKIELGELKGKMVYFTRITASAWRQVSTLQSRINHVVKFSETTDL